jgi:hypothetical protein
MGWLQTQLGERWEPFSDQLLDLIAALEVPVNRVAILQAGDDLIDLLHDTRVEPWAHRLLQRARHHLSPDVTILTEFRGGDLFGAVIPAESTAIDWEDVRKAVLKTLHPSRIFVGYPEGEVEDLTPQDEGAVTPTPPPSDDPNARPTRYFNTLLTAAGDPAELPADRPIRPGETFRLHVEIGPEPLGLDAGQNPFPDRAVEPLLKEQGSIDLTVVAVSRQFTVEPRHQPLTLPAEGATERIAFTLTAGSATSRGTVWVELFYRGFLLQTKRIMAWVVAEGDKAPVKGPMLSAKMIFTTAVRLEPAVVRSLPDRVLTVTVSRDKEDAKLDFRVFDRTRGFEELTLYETEQTAETIDNVVNGVRRVLRRAVVGESRAAGDPRGPGAPGLQYGLNVTDAQLNAWLPRLADVGYALFYTIFPEDGRPPQMPPAGSAIQVDPLDKRMTVPWNLMYQRAFVRSEGKNRLCATYAGEDPGTHVCPDAGNEFVVCPYEFWGYRYSVEQLPGWFVKKRRPFALVDQVSNGRPAVLNVNVNGDFKLWQGHLGALRKKAEIELLKVEQLDELKRAWARTDIDLVYFYCHGGRDPVSGLPSLEITGGPVNGNVFQTFHPSWSHRPLVVLNGCSTGDYTSRSAVSLINDFLDARASGVVGTECPLPEPLAEAYMASLFPRLFSGELLGPAMREVRLELLRTRRNPLGLAYMMYAAHDINLSRSVLRAQS